MDRVSPALRLIVEHLPDCPAIVFSRFGEVLLQTHAVSGEAARYRQVLVDPVDRQVLVIHVL